MFRRAFLFLWLLPACFQGVAFAGVADERVLYNGKIFTGEPEHPYAEAVAVRNDKIVAVGNFTEVSKAVAKSAELIDLKGNFLMPGLVDSHCHAVEGGLSRISARVNDSVSSVEQLAAFAAEAKRAGREMPGDILMVSGIPLVFWDKIDALGELFNAKPFAEQPVLLRGMDGHAAWANKTLLKRAGINKQFIDSLDPTSRHYFGVGSDGEPNGYVVDAEVKKLDAVVPEWSSEQMLRAGREAVKHLHKLGITAWLDPNASEAILATYRKLAESGELHSEVAALPVVDFKQGHPEQQLATALEWRKQFENVPGVRIIGIKVYADGVAEYPAQTAALSKPYRNSGRVATYCSIPRSSRRLRLLQTSKE